MDETVVICLMGFGIHWAQRPHNCTPEDSGGQWNALFCIGNGTSRLGTSPIVDSSGSIIRKTRLQRRQHLVGIQGKRTTALVLGRICYRGLPAVQMVFAVWRGIHTRQWISCRSKGHIHVFSSGKLRTRHPADVLTKYILAHLNFSLNKKWWVVFVWIKGHRVQLRPRIMPIWYHAVHRQVRFWKSSLTQQS